MQYLLLIYTNEAEISDHPDRDAYIAFTQDIIRKGQFKGGEALHPTSMATTVRVRGGKTMATDGPFAETREQLVGFYLIEAKDLDEATGVAARIPDAKRGSIEVRPIDQATGAAAQTSDA